MVLAVTSTDEKADACRAAGGTVNSSSKAAGGLSAKGKYVTTIVTINTCLDKKGNVTNVW